MKYVHLIARYMGYVATGFVGLMTLLTVADICGRFFFNQPITGVTELSALMLVVVVTMGFGWCAIERKHVSVDIVMSRMPKKMQSVTELIFLVITFILFGIITWRTAIEATEADQYSSLLRIPTTPFFWLLVVGWTVFCLSVLVVFIEDIRGEVKK